MPKKNLKGFTLIELLVVLAIVSILAAVVLVIINPLELLARSRDATRVSDMEGIQKAIDTVLADASTQTALLLCTGLTPPCTESTYPTGANTRKNNGTGWVKVNFSAISTITVATLPVDPTNSNTYKYTYYSDGNKYELNAVLESTQYKSKMSVDGGDNNNIYETGSSLILLH